MKLSTRAKALISTGLILAVGGAVVAIQQVTTSGAEEVLPIFTQVEEHDGRIGTLEGRADQTDAKVEQNSADIQVVQQETGIAPAAPRSVSSGPAPTSTTSTVTVVPAPTPAPTPAPQPVKNPRLITGVAEATTTPGMHSCHYTLHDAGQNVTAFIQPVELPCYAVGEVLPYV